MSGSETQDSSATAPRRSRRLDVGPPLEPRRSRSGAGARSQVGAVLEPRWSRAGAAAAGAAPGAAPQPSWPPRRRRDGDALEPPGPRTGEARRWSRAGVELRAAGEEARPRPRPWPSRDVTSVVKTKYCHTVMKQTRQRTLEG